LVSLGRFLEKAMNSKAPSEGSAKSEAAAASASASEIEDLDRVTRCRAVFDDAGARWSDETPGEGAQPWHQAWLAQGHDYGVVYGHWALQGLHVAPQLRGLDTGCVHHGRNDGKGGKTQGRLTAWLPDASAAFDTPDERFWHIDAQRRYFQPGDD